MDQRQLEKENIRLTREIAMLETQLSAAQRGKEEKIEENKHIKAEIEVLEKENLQLEEETRRLDEEIAGLDEEFKQAQLDAGRLRREIKVSIERAENENKQAAELRARTTKFERQLDTLKREVKQEIDDRRNLEGKLRKTNAHIDAMKSNRWSSFVTRSLEKQDWYQRTEAPYPSPDGEDPGAAESVSAGPVVEPAKPEGPVASPADVVPEAKKDKGGIDFSAD